MKSRFVGAATALVLAVAGLTAAAPAQASVAPTSKAMSVAVPQSDLPTICYRIMYQPFVYIARLPWGDANGDGIVSSFDAFRVTQLAAQGLYTPCGDVDRDGVLTATDASNISKAASGSITLPVA